MHGLSKDSIINMTYTEFRISLCGLVMVLLIEIIEKCPCFKALFDLNVP